VTQADIDEGNREGVPSDSAAEICNLEQENRELTRAKGTLRWAASFFGAELDREHKMKWFS
jgi:hypothetical protein